MTLRLGGDGAITGCTSLENPDLTVSGLTISGSFDAEKVLVASGTAAAPSYTFSGDTDNGLYYAGTNSIGLATAGTNAILIDSTGNVGIGTTNPLVPFVLSHDGNTNIEMGYSTGTSSHYVQAYNRSTSAYQQLDLAGNVLTFKTPTERMRIDSSGRLLVGTSTSRNVGANTSGRFQLEQSAAAVSASIVNNVNAATGAIISLAKTRGSSTGSNTVVQNNDQLGELRFVGADGTSVEINAARIGCFVDGTPGSNDMPGRLVFSTTADGASSPTERMRIDNSGNVGIGTTAPAEMLEVQDGSISIGSSTNTNSTNTLISGYGYILSGTKYGNTSIRSTYSNATNAASLEFYVASSSTSTDERMRIDSVGLVGIGRTPDSTYSQYTVQVKSNTDQGSLIHFSRPSDGTTTSNDGLLVGLGVDTNSYVYNREPGNLIFGTNNAERMRILSTGGLTFNGDTAQANALDDYEEGTFTPSFTNAGTATYAVRVGYYVKIGHVVTATVFIQFASQGSASGNVAISGFPFLTKNLTNLYAVSSSVHGTGWSVTRNSVNILIPAGQTTSNVMYYNMVSQGATYGQVQHSDLGLGNVLVSFNYIAN